MSCMRIVRVCNGASFTPTYTLIPTSSTPSPQTLPHPSLKSVSASQGLMLESLSPALLLPGAPHHACPDKAPGPRLETLAAAGLAQVPFTTGLLVGIGEGRRERVEALLVIRRLQEAYGHIQEVIIQNFR
jgi:FO synthase